MPNKTKGFAALNPHDRSRIAQLGGKAAHAKGTAHEWTHDEAVEAGRKGGTAKGQRWHLAERQADDAPLKEAL